MNNWLAFKNSVNSRFPQLNSLLDCGTSKSQIAALEQRTSISLPQAFIDIYLDSNGQDNKTAGFYFGGVQLSLDEIVQAMEREFPLIEELKGEWDMCSSTPPDAIQLAYANERWIPLWYFGRGAFIGLDFSPGPAGTQGQVINFGINEEDKFVLAKSLDEFLYQSTQKLVSGENIKFDEELNMYFYTEFSFISALARDLMTALKEDNDQ